MAEMSAVVPALARWGNVTVEGATTEDASFALRIRGGLEGRFTAAGEDRDADAVARAAVDQTDRSSSITRG